MEVTITQQTMQQSTLVINVTDGMSYDAAFQNHKSEGRDVVTISARDLYELHCKLINPMNSVECTMNQTVESNLSTPPRLETLEMKRERLIEQIRTCIDCVGYLNTTLNMECCSSYDLHPPLVKQYVFINKNISDQVIDFMVYLLSKGSQVICADFALKALISNWNPDKFGTQCPVEQVGHIQGDLYVRYNIDACKESCFPQLKTVAQLAIPDTKDTLLSFNHCNSMTEHKEDQSLSSMSMNAMGKTIVYRVLDSIDTNLSVIVMSVAVGSVKTVYETNSQKETILEDNPLGIPPLVRQNSGEIVLPPFQSFESKQSIESNQSNQSIVNTDNPSQLVIKKTIDPFNMKDYDRCVATIHGTDSTVKGLPVHTIVTFTNMPGSLVMSSLHLTNLTAVNTNLKNVVDSATNILGRQRSAQMEEQLKQAEKYGIVALTRTISDCVTEIASSSHIYSKNNLM
jgi:hypothetical protein